MNLTTLDWCVLIAYFAIVVVIGIISTRLIHNREDFLMGGRRFGKVMMVMFAFGAGTHADGAVGVASQSYRVGLSGIWYGWIMVFTLPLYWLLAPIFRRSRMLTTADFFEARYGKMMMYVYSAFALFVVLTHNGLMLFGSGKLIEAITQHAVPWQAAVIVMAFISFIYAIAGGLIAAVWNDLFQGTLTIVMSVLLIPFFWHEVGGLPGVQSRLASSGHPRREQLFDLVLGEDMTVFWIVMVTFTSLISMVSQPQIMASAASGRSEMDSRVGFVGGMVLKRLMTVPWALSGLMAIALLGFSPETESDHVFGLMTVRLLPSGCVGLMLACVMASLMDNCAVNMLSFAGIYTNSIHNRLINPTTDERQLVRVNRLVSIFFAVASIGLACMFTDVPSAMRFLWQTVPLMGIPWLFAILWRRANRWGALASFIAAELASAYANFVLGWSGDAGLPYSIALYSSSGIVAGIVVSLLTPPEHEDRTSQFFLLLKTPIGQEHILREAGYQSISGTDTFALPVDSQHAPSDRPFQMSHWVSKLDLRESRLQSIVGFLVLVVLTLVLVAAVKQMAVGLSKLLP